MSHKKFFKRLNPLVLRVLHTQKHKASLFGSIAISFVLVCIGIYQTVLVVSEADVLGANIAGVRNAYTAPVIEIEISKIPTLTPTSTPTNTPTPIPTNPPTNVPTPTTNLTQQNSQYTAEKIGDTTWRVSNVQNDTSMASAQDIVNALNSYRGERGRANLSVDPNLSSFAQQRANHFFAIGNLDSHAGFRDYMNNGGFEKSGFNGLGENSAMLSGPMNGDRIIRNIFGADPEHDGNQLDYWTHVGVGISGNFINVNFGKNKR